MVKKAHNRKRATVALAKCLTGIQGLDEITNGGLPKGRPTLVCGSAGSGKSLMAMEFLVRGAMQYGEPGVFMAFEETAKDLTQNVASLGFDLPSLISRKKLLVDYVHVDRNEIEETGEYDLEGLFVRLDYAVRSIGAKRVALDTLETLFSGFNNTAVLRAELRRLFHWLKDKGLTTIITAERGEGALTRQGLEEYVSDCVMLLDHRVHNRVATRMLRVVKYRGSVHGTNEYPFLIDETGFSVVPITSMRLDHPASTNRVSTGVAGLDDMLGGKGYYRGSSVLVSGMAGAGKSSVSAAFANAAWRRGERVLYFATEESPQQILRNMKSIGIDLQPGIDKGLLRFHSVRPGMYGLEMHLAMMHKRVNDFNPAVVIIDPISNLHSVGELDEVKTMLTLLIDFLKGREITTVLTDLTSSASNTLEGTDVHISSLIDTWFLLKNMEQAGERTRVLYLLKSRGMAHSNQVREFVLSSKGIGLVDVHVGPNGVLTGSLRQAHEAKTRAEVGMRRKENERKRQELASRIAALEAEFEATQRQGDETVVAARDAERQILRGRGVGTATSPGTSPRRGGR